MMNVFVSLAQPECVDAFVVNQTLVMMTPCAMCVQDNWELISIGKYARVCLIVTVHNALNTERRAG